MKKGILTAFVALALGTCLAVPALANAPALIPYQGRLTDAAGNPLSGNQTVVFTLYADSTAAGVLWTETRNITVNNGLFNVVLGQGTPFPVGFFSFGTEFFLGIKVGADPEMTPRQRWGAVPYAMSTLNSPGVAGNSGEVNAYLATGVQNFGARTIYCPTAGNLVVTGWVHIYWSHIVGTTSRFHMGLSQTSGVLPSNFVEHWESSGNASGQYATGLSVQVNIPVGGVGNQTVYLVGGELEGNYFLYEWELTLLFIPDALGPFTSPNGMNREPEISAIRGTPGPDPAK